MRGNDLISLTWGKNITAGGFGQHGNMEICKYQDENGDNVSKWKILLFFLTFSVGNKVVREVGGIGRLLPCLGDNIFLLIDLSWKRHENL